MCQEQCFLADRYRNISASPWKRTHSKVEQSISSLVVMFLTLALASTPSIHSTIISYCHTHTYILPCVLNVSIIAGYYLRLAAEQNCMQRFLVSTNFWFKILSLLDSLIVFFTNLSTEQRTTQQGQVYFLHTQTGVSTWHDPRVPRYVYDLCLHF